MILVVSIGKEDVNVIVAEDMPIGMKEHIYKNSDNTYTMKLNAKYTHEALCDAYSHASEHLTEDDYSKTDVQEIETKAHERR